MIINKDNINDSDGIRQKYTPIYMPDYPEKPSCHWCGEDWDEDHQCKDAFALWAKKHFKRRSAVDAMELENCYEAWEAATMLAAQKVMDETIKREMEVKG